MKSFTERVVSEVVAALLGLTAFFVYLSTLSQGPYPGESAQLVVQNIGILPRLGVSSPFWRGLVNLIYVSSPADLSFRLNVFSAVCASLGIWLLFRIVSEVVYYGIDVNDANSRRAWVASLLAGIGASLFFAFCVPFWTVTNRAHVASFDQLILLTAAWCFFAYVRYDNRWMLLLCAFVVGAGMVEFATLLVFIPVALLYGILLSWRREELNAGLVFQVVVCFLLGFSLYFLVAWQYYETPGYELRQFSGYFQLLRIIWRDQYFTLISSLPRVGWLAILFLTAVPWLTAVAVGERGLNEEKDWSYYILHIILTGLAGMVLFRVESTWVRFQPGRSLVTPYLLAASVFGYLVAYWFLIPSTWWSDAEEGARFWMAKWFGLFMAVPLIGVAAYVPFRNLAQADARDARVINMYAQSILDSLEGRQWLITDGMMDNHLYVLAKEQGIPLRLLNVRAGFSNTYMKYVSQFFESASLRNLAQLGISPLIRGWLQQEENATDEAAVIGMPDLWGSVGYESIPYKQMFLGVKSISDVDGERLFHEHLEFWNAFLPYFEKVRVPEDMTDRGTGRPYLDIYGRYVGQQMGLIANNLGVLMQDLDRPEYAVQAYRTARKIDPGNISVLLNLIAMSRDGKLEEDGETMTETLKKRIAALGSSRRIWSLSQYYGYVRSPRAFAELGWTWALSGRPGLAISGLKRALSLVSDQDKEEITRTLADIYLLEEYDEESAKLYGQILKDNPENQRALLGMARVSTRRGEFDKARELLKRAVAAGVSEERMSFEWALLYVASGDTEQARVALSDLLEKYPENSQAWELLIDILFRQEDEPALKSAVQKMQQFQIGSDYVRAYGSGFLAILQKDYQSARKNFDRALVLRSNSPRILEWLLRLDLLQRRRSEAREHSLRLLNLAPDNAFGNYVMGTLHSAEGEMDLAEDSLRKSLKYRRTAEALNDLAWILQERGAYEEAEEYARAALEMDDQVYQRWDTLGTILMKTERLKEAEAAFEKALSLFRQDMGVFVRMAELEMRMGNRGKALELLNVALEKQDRLSPELREKLDQLKKQLYGL